MGEILVLKPSAACARADSWAGIWGPGLGSQGGCSCGITCTSCPVWCALKTGNSEFSERPIITSTLYCYGVTSAYIHCTYLLKFANKCHRELFSCKYIPEICVRPLLVIHCHFRYLSCKKTYCSNIRLDNLKIPLKKSLRFIKKLRDLSNHSTKFKLQ